MELDDLLALVGRLLMASIFLSAAFGKITNFEATLNYMEAHGMPAATFFCALAIVIEVLGGVAIVLGFHSRWGAAALAGFLIAATWIFHSGADQRIHLLKNLAILGGLFQIMAFGPGGLSLEGRDRAALPNGG